MKRKIKKRVRGSVRVNVLPEVTDNLPGQDGKVLLLLLLHGGGGGGGDNNDTGNDTDASSNS